MATLALLLIASSTLFWEEKSTRLWTVLVWAICVAAIFTSTNDAVKIAFIMAIIAFGLTLLAPKLTFAMVFICSLALLTVPITYCTVGPDSLATIFPISWIEEIGQLNISFKHRIAIYSFALESSCSHSWAGWGVGSTSLIPGGQEPMAGYRDFLLLPSHPHNMPIQVMLETGIIGLGFVLAIFSTFFVAIYSKINNRPLTATVLGIIVCYLIIASLSYSAWASWFLMTGIFAAMILNLCQKSQKINS